MIIIQLYSGIFLRLLKFGSVNMLVLFSSFLMHHICRLVGCHIVICIVNKAIDLNARDSQAKHFSVIGCRNFGA
jgi:hypothetical protein